MSSTRGRIIQAAIESFAANGFHAAGIQDIIDRAKVNRPSLYHFFGSKEGLWTAVYDYLAEDLVSFADQNLVIGKSLRKNLQSVVDVLVKYHELNPDKLRIIFQTGISRDEEDCKRFFEKYNPRINEIVLRAFTPAAGKGRDAALALFISWLEVYAINLATQRCQPEQQIATSKVLQMVEKMANSD